MTQHATASRVATTLADAYHFGEDGQRFVIDPVDTFADLRSIGLDAAYLAQDLVVDHLRDRSGATDWGYKLGLTSPAAQADFDTSEPIYGRLLSLHQVEEGARLDAAALNGPLVEAELLLRLSEEPGADLTPSLLAETVEVAAAIEVPSSRIREWKSLPLGLSEIVADNALAAHVVVGATWVPASSLDLRRVTAVLEKDGRRVGSGEGKSVMGGPLRALSWVLSALRVKGKSISSGAVFCTGALAAPVPAERGAYRAQFSGPLGMVSVHIE